MAVSTNPTAPRKLTPPTGAATLDPMQASPTGLAGPDSSPQSSGPNLNPIPNSAMGISQLPDGVGGAVTVPPTTMAPPSVLPSYDQTIAAQPVAPAPANGVPSGPTDLKGRPLSADGTYHPIVGPTFTNDASGNVATFQQPNGTWTNADGSAIPAGPSFTMAKDLPDWGLPGSGLGTSADPSGQLQRAAGYVPWDPATNGPAATSASSPLAGRLPVMTGPDLGPATARPLTPSAGAADVRPSIPVGPSLGPVPTAGGATMPTTFSADQNLINAQINPAASARLLGAQSQTDSTLGKILNGPDRAQLGQQYYDTFAKRAAANFGRGLTDATNRAAAHGQIGSGMLTNAYGDLAERFNLDNTTAASDFATKALEGTIGDNLNNFAATRANENSIYGQDLGARNELRGERGYQQSLAEQAIARRIQQQQYEDAQQQQSFDNGRTLYGLGNASDPTNAYENAATLASGEAGANSADVAALLKYFAQRRNPVGVG